MKEIDELAGWLDLLREAKQRKDIEYEQIKMCREKIEEALGESEMGTVNGKPVVSWRWVKSNRLDQTLAKQVLTPAQLQSCMTEVNSRRFILVGND